MHREEKVKWFTAVNRCLANNGSLAVFDDDILTYFASSLLNQEPLWIGLIKSWWTWSDAGTRNYVLLPTALARQVTNAIVSVRLSLRLSARPFVRPSVSPLCLRNRLTVDLELCTLTIAHRVLKVEVIGQGQGQGLG